MQSLPVRFRKARLLPAVFVMLWSFPLHATDLPSAKPEDVGLSTERLARIDKAIEASISQKEIAGAVAIIARHGKVAFQTFRNGRASLPPN